MSITVTNLTIDVLEARIARELEERYAFQRMLAATDRVLWRLEELNRRGVKFIPSTARVRESLSELPASCLQALRDSDSTQEVLDSVFDVQARLLALHVPGYEVALEEEAAEVGEGDGGR